LESITAGKFKNSSGTGNLIWFHPIPEDLVVFRAIGNPQIKKVSIKYHLSIYSLPIIAINMNQNGKIQE